MTLDINLFAPEMLADPYSTYCQLRTEDPVHWYQPIGAWILTSYEDVDYALHEPRFSSKLEVAWMSSAQKESAGGILGRDESQQNLYAFVNNSLVFSDPPQHTRLRALVSKAFTPRAIEASKQLITTLLDGFLDAVAGNGSVDIVRDLAYPLPLAVIGSV
jgi:cytochrome P450